MTLSRLRHTGLCVVLLSLASACPAEDPDENCIANCDASTGDATTSASTSGTTVLPGDESGGSSGSREPSMTCADLQAEALAFYEANSSCTSLLDCRPARADCFPPGVPAACTGIALAKTADFGAWDELNAQIFAACTGACNFEGDCGSYSLCGPEQRCIEVMGDMGVCEVAQSEVDAFLVSNTACEEDDDCLSVSSCTLGSSCSPIALNTSANLDDWALLENTFDDACDYMDEIASCSTSGGCEAPVRCGERGRCEVAP